MKKADMESHRKRYKSLMTKARKAERNGLFRDAVKHALASWDYIDGMMRYERRYKDAEFDSVEAIELVLKYTPLLFDKESVQKLDGLLRERRTIEKHTSVNLADKLADVSQSMWENHRMWSYVEANPEVRQDEMQTALGGDQTYWRTVAEQWERMGLLHREPDGRSYRLSLRTRMGQVVSGMCSECGKMVEAPKSMFLEKLGCPACECCVMFVLLGK